VPSGSERTGYLSAPDKPATCNSCNTCMRIRRVRCACERTGYLRVRTYLQHLQHLHAHMSSALRVRAYRISARADIPATPATPACAYVECVARASVPDICTCGHTCNTCNTCMRISRVRCACERTGYLRVPDCACICERIGSVSVSDL
jgi:hypothetical protein